jgi:NADP-dependent 3-hydroxy acid dehydrogenase YdfG
LAVADAYDDKGASVVVFGINPDTLAAAQRQLGDPALAVEGDVTERADLEHLFDTTAGRFGKIDVLVANAGGINFTPLGEDERGGL